MKDFLFFIFSLLLLTFAACSSPYQIRDGNTAFELKKYALATELLHEEYTKARMRETRAEKSFLLAESYYRSGNYEAASTWYETSISHGYGLSAREGRAKTLMNLEFYTEAELAYRELLNDFGQLDIWSNNMRAAGLADDLKTKALERNVILSKIPFNSYYSDYSVAFYDENILVFSSDRIHSEANSSTYSWTGRSFFNFWTYDLSLERFTEDFNFLNSEFNEGTLSFSGDRQTVFFTRCTSNDLENGFCRIYTSNKISTGLWTDPNPLSFQDEKSNFVHPAVSKDGSMLIFSHKPKNHEGGYNLYVSYFRAGEWLNPLILEGNVNTTGNESFPYLAGDTLYFSSDGHPGMGGLDIFRAVLQADRSWGAVENLLPPINSGADDFAYVPDPFFKPDGEVLNRGYFSSARGGSTDDIYFFEVLKTPDSKVEEVVFTIQLRGIIMEHLFEDDNDPNSKRLGLRNLPFAEIEIMNGFDTVNMRTSQDSRFQAELKADKTYRVAASADGYLRQSILISTEGFSRDPENPNQVFDIQIVLDKLFLDQEIILEDILYDFDRWEIREDARPTLDKLTQILLDNPEMQIELGSHTDCRGSEDYNIELSQNRAQSAVDYLIENGIAESRLIAKGYGKSFPRINCVCEDCTEEEHQINRRTSFRILSAG